ncbi:MAG: hypothetical protein ABEI99_02435 [Halobaculum sp.]
MYTTHRSAPDPTHRTDPSTAAMFALAALPVAATLAASYPTLALATALGAAAATLYQRL